MLVLGSKVGDVTYLEVGEVRFSVRVQAISGNTVRMSWDADPIVKILRKKVRDRIENESLHVQQEPDSGRLDSGKLPVATDARRVEKLSMQEEAVPRTTS